jgi:beta-lactamase class A
MRVLALILSLLTFIAQPAQAASTPMLDALEQQLGSLVNTSRTDVGIAALDLSNGQSIAIKGDTPFPMASTVKVAVAALYLAQVDHGRRTLDDMINGQSARSLIDRMMIHSDNQATDRLIRNLGGPKALDRWLRENNVQGMRVDRNIATLLADKRDLWDRRDSSTPMAMVQLLRKLYRAELTTPSSRNYLLDVMARCKTGRNRMKALLPFGTPVEHKTGTLNGYTSDVGFITLPDGRRIAVAMFARGGFDRPKTIAESARAIYDGFKSMFTWNAPSALNPS